MLVPRLGANPGHLQLELAVLVVVVDEVDAEDQSKYQDARYSHSRNLLDSLTNGDPIAVLSAIRLTRNNLLELRLRERLALADSARAVAVVNSRGLDAEETRPSLVNTRDQARNAERADRAVAGVRLDIS